MFQCPVCTEEHIDIGDKEIIIFAISQQKNIGCDPHGQQKSVFPFLQPFSQKKIENKGAEKQQQINRIEITVKKQGGPQKGDLACQRMEPVQQIVTEYSQWQKQKQKNIRTE
jgi:hypothetical protein